MGATLGQLLPLAVGVALSPVPIIAVVLMLSTPRGRVNGPAFVLGWVVGLSVVGVLVLVLSGGGAAGDEGPAAWVGWLKLVLGVLLLLLAAKQWSGRPAAGEEAALPAWMQSIDTFTFGRSAGIGVVLSAVNPKNLLLTVAAASTIASSDLASGQAAASLAAFVVIATIGTGVPVLIYVLAGSRAEVLLEQLRGWMQAHNAAIMTVLFLVLGAKLLGDGLSQIT